MKGIKDDSGKLEFHLSSLRINMASGTCDGDCLCGNDHWVEVHNDIIDAALAPTGAAKETP